MSPLLLVLASHASPTPPVTAQMHERFDLLTAIRDAVVQGRTEDARAHANALAELSPPEGLPAGSAGFVAQIVAEARGVAMAKDLPAMAMGTARIAMACASCHGATDGGPGLEREKDVPPQEWTTGANMKLHAWGADWMWLGLLADDGGAWRRGAGELAKRPLPLLFEDARPDGGATQLEQGVYVLAGRALELDAQTERAELYGQLLGTCSECHTKLRK